ncbi:hypothetical protein OAK10_03770, partial [Candidatus Pelagibacter sp.]|nr:hypothetical protein [Candidatus Pelagibacter sp.]
KDDSDHKGKICYTSRNDAGNILVSTFSNELGVSGSTTLRGYTLPVRYTGVQPSSLFRCATAIGSGNAGLDWFATILNNLGNNMCKYSPGDTCTRDTSNFRNAAKQDRGFNDNFPTVAQGYYLLKSDNTIATTPENVEKIMWIQHDTNNVINITENTIGLKINFKTNNAMTLQIHQDATGEGFDTELMANQIYGKTIFGSVQVKTRRSRGAWR